MQPVRIVYLITELNVGGAERTLYELARRLDRRQFSPVVVSLIPGGAVADWLTGQDVPVFDLGLRSPLTTPRAFLRLAHLLRARRPHVLHSFLFHANLLGRLAAPPARVPVVISSVRVAERRRPWHLWLDGLTSPLITVQTTVSESVRRFTHVRAFVPLRKLVTIPNGVDLSRFTLSRVEARRSLGLSGDGPIVVFVGRLDFQKGADLLPRIARRVRSRVPDVLFLVAGSGPMEGALRRRVGEGGLDSAFRFLGQRDDVPTILAAADCLVLPSRWEGLANVILEAQAASTAAVVTDVEGSREAVSDGRTGLLARSGRPDALGDALIRLLVHPEERALLASQARLSVQSVDRMVRENQELYHRLLRSHRGI